MSGAACFRLSLAALLAAQIGIAIAAGDRMDLKAAFKGGRVEVTLTAKDEGATLELRIKNRTKDQLLLVIPQGKTAFDVRDRQIYLVAAAAKNVDLLPGAEATLSFPMEQSGGGRWTGGSVTQSITPAAAQELSKGEKILTDGGLFSEPGAKATALRVRLMMQMKPGTMTSGWAVQQPGPSIQDVEKKYGEADKVEERKKDNNLPADSAVHWYGRIGLAVAKEDSTRKVFWVLVE